ncbi:Dcc1p Ecym_1299 [Eremothecium cymbalariae DBVPG|uniref:Sister chromatid cohesion protein DCC1 n=1 Tax=Eremothecium cymbalariae (strain CBS 270.75 / DBVPG 7215 / KCTC 17166 / NRRL Y-17582) TaxID=931890 RepID=G8JN73_ERECY|nr:hypothetical protein Ecym_1299 [Eremothecium cymbalariae DBVPG\
MASVNLYTELEDVGAYKLLQMTPKLLEAFQDGEVKFKAISTFSDVVLCSKNRTWVVKQRNHSNTVLLMNEFVPQEVILEDKIKTFGLSRPQGDWLGYSKQLCELEPTLVEGLIDVSELPIYQGDVGFFCSGGRKISLTELKDRSPCSEIEFYSKWYKMGGCTVKGLACLLSQDMLFRALHITLMSLLAESLDMSALSLVQVYESIAKDMVEDEGEIFNPYTKEVIETVLHKFGELNNDGDKFKLELDLISQWYGICALKRFASSEPISEDEFMIKWKSLFPPYFQCDIDLELVRGHFARPLQHKIYYLPKNTLPMDIKDRFRQLFKIQSSWELRDIVPFIEELNTKGIKIDSFITKYARRKRVGKAVIVTAR